MLWGDSVATLDVNSTCFAPQGATASPPPFVPTTPPSCCSQDFASITIPGAARMREVARMLSRKTDKQALDHFKVTKSDPRVTQLREFLLALGEPDQRFNFFPLMRQDVRKLHIHDYHCRSSFPMRMLGQSLRDGIDLDGLTESDPDFVNKVRSSDIHCPEWAIATPKSISTSPSSKKLHHTIAKLDLYNALGYDIYICPNELVFGVRSQRTVRKINIIVMEFDHNTLAEQRALLEQVKPNVVAAVYSGGKSIHMFIRLACPIWNDRRPRSFNDMRHLRQSGSLIGGIEIPSYDHAVKCWKHDLQQRGFKVDPSVIGNYAGLVRVPGFRHSLHDRISEIQHLDPLARWNHLVATHPDDWMEFLGSRIQGDDINGSPKGGIPIDIPQGEVGQDGNSVDSWDVVGSKCISVTAMLHQPKPVEDLNLENQGVLIDPKASSSIESHKSALPVKADFDGVTTTFLDALNRFEELKHTGIPARGQRRGLHRVMFTAARIHGWFDDEGRIAKEWESILSIEPSNIRCSVKAGVQDIKGEWRAVKQKPYKLWLPDCGTLADLDETHRESLVDGLTNLGFPRAIRSSTCSIIVNVLWDTVRKATVPCVAGRASIQAKMMQSAGGQKSGKARQWLGQNNLLCLRNRSYVPGKQSMLYFVNAPLIIWLAGYRNEDLNWGLQESRKLALQSQDILCAA